MTALLIYSYITWGIGGLAAFLAMCFIIKEMGEISKKGYADKEDRLAMRENWMVLGGGLAAPLVLPALGLFGLSRMVKMIVKSLGIAFGRSKELEGE